VSEDRLRPLLDSLDFEATERRLKAALAAETTDPGRAEVLTQIARLEGFRGRRDAARALLDHAEELAGEDDVAGARLLLERGRLVRATDGNEAALPLLERAFDAALATGQHFMAADAAHSCALAGDMVTWTQRGLDVADRHPAAAYWRGTLLMNLGDWYWDRGEPAPSLTSFDASLEARESESRNPSLTEYARYGLARALRGLGRPLEAITHLEQAVEWCERNPAPAEDVQSFREELAAAYDAVGRTADAAALRRE
jgi:tetratricopeptide (TPR) repeat protein